MNNNYTSPCIPNLKEDLIREYIKKQCDGKPRCQIDVEQIKLNMT